MTVLLRSSRNISTKDTQYRWYSIADTKAELNTKLTIPGLAELLEDTFTNIGTLWWELGKVMGNSEGGNLAHAPTAASYNSDFGQMLAWVKLTEKLASHEEIFLAVCDDPWLFRELAGIPGVESGSPPYLWLRELYMFFRGYLARSRLAAKLALASVMFSKKLENKKFSDRVVFAYAHPSSGADGMDAYFGDLMKKIPHTIRLIHTDGKISLARRLLSKRTASLHGWGSLRHCLSLIFKKWRIKGLRREDSYHWLKRRSISIENGGAAIASNFWQIQCQERLLLSLKPKIILWPWENHPWERELTRTAKTLGIKTIGYQHAVIGLQQFNPCPKSNVDGLNSIPETIICSGPAYYNQLVKWSVPEEKLVIGGAFRFKKSLSVSYDPSGPVFVAASADTDITKSLIQSISAAKGGGRKFIVKIHPLYPKNIILSHGIEITDKTLPEQNTLSAVVYGTGASGLEGLLAGIPTFRLRPQNKVAINVLPEGIDAVPFLPKDLKGLLDRARPKKVLKWNKIYSPVKMDVWKQQLSINELI